MAAGSSRRTAQVLSLVRTKLSLSQSVEDLRESYTSAEPYPHLVFDNLFPSEVLDSILEELPPISSEKWVHERLDTLVKSNLRSACDLGDRGFEFTSVLHSAGFLYFLSEITGVKPLLPDPYLSGAGYHVIPEGGKFDVHADRNTDQHSGMERKLVMLIYLNRSWKPEYGGQLELWNKEGTQCEKVIEPIFNRMVIFQIGEDNFHAVRPVVKGYGFNRRTFAVYYHSIGKNLLLRNSRYAPKIYQEKGPLLHRLLREAVPPFFYRTMKALVRGREHSE